jgi:uroporphyrinogen-III synthase
MQAKKKILLTRPRSPSERWAALLERQGFASEIEPLLSIVPTGEARPTDSPAGAFQAVMLTSASATEALRGREADMSGLLSLPCFCVGNATADAARSFGFSQVTAGQSDGVALAQAIVAGSEGKGLRLLHIAGDVIDARTQDILEKGGIVPTVWAVYRADATADFSADVRGRFAEGAYMALPVFSPRTARVLVSIVEENRLTDSCHAMTAVALSQAVADVLKTLPWRRLRIATQPTEEEVLACLLTEAAHIDAEAAKNGAIKPAAANDRARPVANAPTPAKRRGKNGWGVVIFLGVALAGIATAPHFSDLHSLVVPHEKENVGDRTEVTLPVLQPLATEQQESSPSLAAEPAPAPQASPQPSSADLAALREQITALQAQNFRVEIEVRNLAAAAVAFWDLHERAQRGVAFAQPLAALQAARHDTAMDSQAALLVPYAESGAQSWRQLRTGLKDAEIMAPAASSDIAPQNMTWRDRLMSMLRTLITVRPAHDDNFAPLEQAVEKNDAQAALAAFAALPDVKQNGLRDWKSQLDARGAVDAALQALTAQMESIDSDKAATQ